MITNNIQHGLQKKQSIIKFVAAGFLIISLLIVMIVIKNKERTDLLPALAAEETCSTGGATGSSATSEVAVNGAIPNDNTDDTDAIQAAIDQANAAGGGVVTLPAGIFIVNGHIQVKSNVKLQGAGADTILKAGPNFFNSTGPAGGYPVVSVNGASNVTIANLTADQSGDILNGNVGNRLTEYLIDVHNSTNVVVDGVSTRNPFTYSIAIVFSNTFCVKNSNTQTSTSGKYNQLDGIHILSSSKGDVINNVVDQGVGADGDDGLVAHCLGGDVHDVTYAYNKVRGGSNGSAMQLAYSSNSDRIYNIKIQNNEFWGSPAGIHTGNYGGGGLLDNVVIGGSAATGNYFHDNGWNAVDLGGSLQNITVSYNNACNSGAFNVGSGSNIVVNNNTTDCSQPQQTSTPTVTSSPTSTPTSSPTETPTSSTKLKLNLFLHGIGKGGDSANPEGINNENPIHHQREITVDIYNQQNILIATIQGNVTFSSATGSYIGEIDTGTNIPNGLYTIKVKTDRYLRSLIPGIQTILSGQVNTLPRATLIVGDINGDNTINILDYGVLLDCYSDILPAANCSTENKRLSDLNDDNEVNQFDYNLFLRDLINRQGE